MLYLQDGRADASGEIRDPDAGLRLSCPLLDSRHTFLEMCQFWHYQFDSLRRAKHSTVMLLYHLHVPRAESLGISCAACARARARRERMMFFVGRPARAAVLLVLFLSDCGQNCVRRVDHSASSL
mgnify:CR=1 FL=1